MVESADRVSGGQCMPWIVTIIILVVIIAVYVVVFLYARKRQKTFDAQYDAAKERHEVFVLNKKVVRERPKSGWMKYTRFKTYQIVGRVSVSQAVKGIQMSRMQTMTFHTSKSEFDKIQNNHKYKMDIAGNYIGYVNAPILTKDTKKPRGKGTAKPELKSGKAEKKGKSSKS
jgi:hypothetical protein